MLTDAGECRMYDDVTENRTKRSVVIWTHAGDLARLRDHLALQRSD